MERVSRGIGIFHLLERPLAEVSGGERTKIALAKILLSRPDFLPVSYTHLDVYKRQEQDVTRLH